MLQKFEVRPADPGGALRRQDGNPDSG